MVALVAHRGIADHAGQFGRAPGFASPTMGEVATRVVGWRLAPMTSERPFISMPFEPFDVREVDQVRRALAKPLLS